MTPIAAFPDYFSFSLFCTLPVALEEKTKFIKICTEFRVKQANILPPKCTSFLLRSKPVRRNCLHFFKIFKKQFEL